ncbi:MAG TPA: peptidoglycan-binding protein LysM, partial [Flavobacterium sp.]
LGFKPFETENHDWFLVDEDEQMVYHFPSQNQTDYKSLNIPYTGKFFIGYKEAIGFKESQGKYNSINTFGCLGKYQFALPTLKSIGIHDSLAFLRSPRLQEKAFVALLSKNKWELKDEIDKYCGKVVGGIKITESGILAAAHLGGVGSVKKFFKSGGKRSIRDGYGTSLQNFMKKFGGYETSAIIADANAKVK